MNRLQATAETLKQRLEEAGFVDVEVVTGKQPFGPWPKEKHMKTVGAMVMLNAEAGAEAYGMEVDRARKICQDMLADVKNKNYHMYTPL
jgi:hypothetical protein